MIFDREKYLNYSKYIESEKMQFKGGIFKGNPLKKIGREVGNAVGTITGARQAQKNQQRMIEEQERQARVVEEEYRRQAQEEAQRRAEERARAEAEAKKRAEEEARRKAEEEAKRQAENHYREQLNADTQALQKESTSTRTVVERPKTTVDFSKSFKFGEDEEDKLKKIFKMGR